MVRSDIVTPQNASVDEAVPVRDLFAVVNEIQADAAANASEYLKKTEVPHGGE